MFKLRKTANSNVFSDLLRFCDVDCVGMLEFCNLQYANIKGLNALYRIQHIAFSSNKIY